MQPSSGLPIVTNIDMQQIPKVRHDVRRRRYGVLTLLIRKNDWYQIDRTTDFVWLRCEDGLPIGRIASEYGAAFGVPVDEALAAMIVTIARFQAYGLIFDIFDLAAMVAAGDIQNLEVCPETGSA
jgi:hypothetical protein